MDQHLEISHNRIVRSCLIQTFVPLLYSTETVG